MYKRQDEEKAIKIGILKLTEEVGELSKAILEKNWEEVPAEVTDIIVFACKLANIAEDFHNTEKLVEVMEAKLEFCEKRVYDKETVSYTHLDVYKRQSLYNS